MIEPFLNKCTNEQLYHLHANTSDGRVRFIYKKVLFIKPLNLTFHMLRISPTINNGRVVKSSWETNIML